MKRILVAVDGSEGANRAVAFAGRLARDAGAELTLQHVYDAPTAAALGLQSVAAEDIEKTKNYMAQGSFDAARRALAEAPPSVTQHVSIGHPGREIVTHAQVIQADLVVVGSRGRSSLESLLLGSVSEYVVRHAGCPVTVVR